MKNLGNQPNPAPRSLDFDAVEFDSSPESAEIPTYADLIEPFVDQTSLIEKLVLSWPKPQPTAKSTASKLPAAAPTALPLPPKQPSRFWLAAAALLMLVMLLIRCKDLLAVLPTM